MRRTSHCPQHILVDARTVPGVSAPQASLNKGDGINFSIAAASIIAKTERDRMMEELDRAHPGYGFAVPQGLRHGRTPGSIAAAWSNRIAPHVVSGHP